MPELIFMPAYLS